MKTYINLSIDEKKATFLESNQFMTNVKKDSVS